MKARILAVVVTLSLAGAAWAATVRDEPIQPLAVPKITNPAKVELGKKLFFDPRLSRSGFISCNSCHNLSMGGSDNLKTSIGDKWQQGPINSPTVLNSSLAVAQFWDGRAASLQEQAGGPSRGRNRSSEEEPRSKLVARYAASNTARRTATGSSTLWNIDAG